MSRYVLRRLLQALGVLWLLTVIVFGAAGGGCPPLDLMLPQGAPPSQRQQMIEDLGLDEPLPVQYWHFVSNAAQGDFGESIRFHAPAMELVLDRMPATIELAVAAFVLAIAVGVPLGILGALREGRPTDHAITSVLTLGQATPSFWLGILLILYVGVRWELLPIAGRSGIESLIMPAVTLSVIPLVAIARLTRSSVIGVLPQDYVRTATAKGLRRRTVVGRHVLRNGLIPIVTIAGISMAELLSGAVITEQVFAWPGIGRLAIESINARDFPVIQAVTLLTSTIVVVLSLVVDLSYFFLDPRVRTGGSDAG